MSSQTNRQAFAATRAADRRPGDWARADIADIQADIARVIAADARARQLRAAYAERRTPAQPRGIFAVVANWVGL